MFLCLVEPGVGDRQDGWDGTLRSESEFLQGLMENPSQYYQYDVIVFQGILIMEK